MKFTRIITFSLISALSIGTLIGVAEVNKAPVDRKFTIEDQKGNRDALGTMSLSNIIKVGDDKFEQVILTKDQVRFKNTKYDQLHGVGEKVLNNKDMYRGINFAVDYENNKFKMIASFNASFPYGSNDPYVTIAKKDKKTKELQKEKIAVTGITTNQHFYNETLFEYNDIMYYGVVFQNMSSSSGKSLLKIYQVMPNNLQLKEVMNIDVSLSGDYTEISRIIVDENKLYMMLSNQQEFKLLIVDLATKKDVKINLPQFTKDNTYIETFTQDENYFYISVDSKVFVLDKKTYKQVNKEVMQPSFVSNYDHVGTVDQITNKETLYVLYEGYKNNGQNDMLIVAYDSKSGKTLYEGKLPSMIDRGVGERYSFSSNQ